MAKQSSTKVSKALWNRNTYELSYSTHPGTNTQYAVGDGYYLHCDGWWADVYSHTAIPGCMPRHTTIDIRLNGMSYRTHFEGVVWVKHSLPRVVNRLYREAIALELMNKARK